MSHVLRVPGAPKLTTVPRTLFISTASAARVGHTDCGGSFSIPVPESPASPPTQAAPRYLTAYLPASPTHHLVWPWHPGTTPLPAWSPAWHRSHLPRCQVGVKIGDSRGRSVPHVPWLSAPRLNTHPCVGGNPHLQISFLNKLVPLPPPRASVSLGAPALPPLVTTATGCPGRSALANAPREATLIPLQGPKAYPLCLGLADAPAEDVIVEETGAHSSIFICPGTVTNVGTGAGLNSPPTEWPYQPEVLQASPPSLSTLQPLSLGSVAGLSHPLQTHRCPLALPLLWF